MKLMLRKERYKTTVNERLLGNCYKEKRIVELQGREENCITMAREENFGTTANERKLWTYT